VVLRSSRPPATLRYVSNSHHLLNQSASLLAFLRQYRDDADRRLAPPLVVPLLCRRRELLAALVAYMIGVGAAASRVLQPLLLNDLAMNFSPLTPGHTFRRDNLALRSDTYFAIFEPSPLPTLLKRALCFVCPEFHPHPEWTLAAPAREGIGLRAPLQAPGLLCDLAHVSRTRFALHHYPMRRYFYKVLKALI